MGRKTREKGSIPEKVDYSDLLRELQGNRKDKLREPTKKYNTNKYRKQK